MPQKQKFEIKKEIVNPYRARQMDTFQELGTYPDQWDMLQIQSIDKNGKITYESLPDYKTIFPHFKRYLKENKLKEKDLDDVTKGKIKYGSCQLCGHWIEYPYWIKCPAKKLIMHVGSTCINEFKGAEYVYRQIKIFESSQLRDMFKKWIDYGIDICNSKKVEGSYYMILPEYYDFRKKLFKVKDHIDELSDQKIKNIFKKAAELKIPVDTEQIKIQKEEKDKVLKTKKAELKAKLEELKNLGYKFDFRSDGKLIWILNKEGEALEYVNHNEKVILDKHGVKWSETYGQFVLYTNLDN